MLRIGGAFSDWSELPPLSSLIRLWGGRSVLSRLVVGNGATGIPYIHRDDVVRIVRRCIDRHESLAPHEVFLASQDGTVLHKDLFRGVQQARTKTAAQPVFIPPGLANIGLCLKRCVGCLTRNRPFERPWMLRYVDRPWVVDASDTRNKLGWSCTDGMGILDRLTTILDHFRKDRRRWKRRNEIREKGQYSYHRT